MRLIDADILIKTIRMEQEAIGRDLTVDDVVAWIEIAPVAGTIEHGVWTSLPVSDWPFVCRCSVCGDRNDGHTLFCPQCGAYMDDTHEALQRDGYVVVKGAER